MKDLWGSACTRMCLLVGICLVATFLDYDIGQCNLTERQISSSESPGSHPGKKLSGGDII
jgi:hypothetical protein